MNGKTQSYITTSKEGENGFGKSVEGRELAKYVQKVETQILQDTNKLDKVTNQIASLLKKSDRVNVLVDSIRSNATFEGVVGENYNTVSTASPTDITSQKCILVNKGNKESRTSVMDKILSLPSESRVEEGNEYMLGDECFGSNTFERRIENDITNCGNDKTNKVIKHSVSNIVLDETLHVRIDNNSLKTVESRNYKTNMTKASISDFENLHNKDNKENIQWTTSIENDNQLKRLSTEGSSYYDNSEKHSKQVIQTRTKIRENGYKSKSMEIQHDNRVRYHSKHECFEGTTINNILNMDLDKEEFIPPNIKPEETLLFTQERFKTPRRRRRRSLEEDSCVCEWLKYNCDLFIHSLRVQNITKGHISFFRSHKGRLSYSHDIAIQAHMIVFTNGSSAQDMPTEDDDDDDNTFSFRTLRVRIN
ncbi:unnamed protein product [Mytilus coruscus]|uniref:Uncharacterized protein n=1 Tax=Mytilus coruscus TaxID=42192 RepID=A0A6J8BI80_MYTCO|nr:unnamed protein product [Mytilus coruscus]